MLLRECVPCAPKRSAAARHSDHLHIPHSKQQKNLKKKRSTNISALNFLVSFWSEEYEGNPRGVRRPPLSRRAPSAQGTQFAGIAPLVSTKENEFVNLI